MHTAPFLVSSVRFLSALTLLAAGVGGCGVRASTSVKGEADASGDVEVADFDRPLAEEDLAEAAEDKQATGQPETAKSFEATPTPAQPALLGARHDVRLGPSMTIAQCQCLAVVVGSPTTAGMTWGGTIPSIDPKTQTVIALGSEGVSCDQKVEGLGASYMGYERVGDDVVVTVEVARMGRPVTRGAIIPKPSGDGKVYVKPSGKATPYGRGPSGEARCAVGS